MREDEEILLSCLLNSFNYTECAKQLKKEFFTVEEYGRLFDELIKGNNNVPSLAAKTGVPLENILKIASIEPNPLKITIETYCYKIISDYKQNETIRLKNEISDADELLKALQELSALDYRFEQSVDESATFLKEVEAEMQHKSNPDITYTGFNGLDKLTKGFKKSELIILGGRPASGKSAFGVNVAVNMAKQGKKVLFVSLEMTKLEIHERIVKAETEISNFRNLDYEKFENIVNVSRNVKKLPIEIIDNGNTTLELLEKRIKSYKEQNKVDVVFIDHIGILETATRYNSRYEQITNISRRLKVIAKDNDIPVIALCQLNRGLENREFKAPTMADLRDSGAIEQDANLIMFIYRPEYHLLQAEPDKNHKDREEWEQAMARVKGKAYIIVSKNRRGQNGRYEMGFKGELYKFYDLGGML